MRILPSVSAELVPEGASGCLLLLLIGVLLNTILTAKAQTMAVSSGPTARQIELVVERVRVKPSDPQTLSGALAVGFDLLSASRYADAWSIFSVILDATPGSQQSNYGGALALFNLGNIGKAEQLARTAVELSSVNASSLPSETEYTSAEARKHCADSLVLLGTILAVKGDNGGALKSVTRAVELSPDNFDAQFALGRALYGAGDPRKAVVAFQRAIALRPIDITSRFFLATTLEAAGDYDHARTAYSELIAIRPDSPEGHLGLGVLLVKLDGDKTEEGIRELERAIALNGNLYEARVTLGRTLIKAGRATQAVVHLQRAAELAPNNPEAHYQLAIAYRRLGRRFEAAAESDKVKAINAGRRGRDQSRESKSTPNE